MYQIQYTVNGMVRNGGKQYRHYGTATALARGAITTGHYDSISVVHVPTGRTMYTIHRRPVVGQGWLPAHLAGLLA